uniref:Uncharacterized protein n=1 Tax=Zea mays TaxID=4577 RepID=C0PAG0_MAIZE|nr:unknown [Zea mays]
MSFDCCYLGFYIPAT